MRISRNKLVALGLSLAAFLCSSTLHAGERRFTFVNEATTTPKGLLELENWVTWERTSNSPDDDSNDLEFRHELEYGLTDRFQVSLYFDWSLLDDAEKDHHVRFHDVALEGKLNLSNPVTDLVGSALYGEVKVGNDLVELEGKVLLQKNIGRWMIAYNAILEAEWEGEGLDEETGEFAQSIGISYEVTPSFTVGVEALHEIEFPEWNYGNRGDNVVYAGPNASIRYAGWFLTVTPLIQVTSVEEEPDVQTRFIFGTHF